MEKLIYGLFKINQENLIGNMIYLAKEYHIPPSEIERMQYVVYETFLEQVNVIAKQQEEQNKKQQEDMDNMRSSMKPGNYMPNMNQQMGNMKMPSMKMPTMPQVSIPKL